MNGPEKLYSLYKGDSLLMIGTVEQIAEWQDVERKTVHWYIRSAGSKGEDTLRAYAIDEMEDDR